MTAVMRPAQGSPAFHATASAWVRRTISGPWTTTAPGAKSRAAASLSPALIALLHARATGKGQAIDVAQYEAIHHTTGGTMVEYFQQDIVRERSGNKAQGFQPSPLRELAHVRRRRL